MQLSVQPWIKEKPLNSLIHVTDISRKNDTKTAAVGVLKKESIGCAGGASFHPKLLQSHLIRLNNCVWPIPPSLFTCLSVSRGPQRVQSSVQSFLTLNIIPWLVPKRPLVVAFALVISDESGQEE